MQSEPFAFKKYLALGATCGALSWAGYFGMGAISLPFIAALWGLIFFTPLMVDLVPRIFRHSHAQALGGLQGTHYVFERTRVRVYYAQDKVWLATEDVCRALQMPISHTTLQHLLDGKRHHIIPGTKIVGISEVHMQAFLRHSHAQEKDRFLVWFERGVVLPIRTKIERGIHVPERVD